MNCRPQPVRVWSDQVIVLAKLIARLRKPVRVLAVFSQTPTAGRVISATWLRHCRWGMPPACIATYYTVALVVGAAAASSTHHQKKMEEPIYSKRISAGTRVYYADVRVDKKGQRYMTLTEIPTEKSPGKSKRQRIFIHAENVAEFIAMTVDAAAWLNSNVSKR